MKLSKIGRLFSASKSSPDPQQKHKHSPDPEEMIKSSRLGKSYKGRKVAWNLTVRNMHGEISRNEVLVLTSFEGQPGNIWITVNVDQFPGIYYYAPGSKIAVKGDISGVEGNDIYVDNCQLEPENPVKAP